jgi:nitroreductase
MKTLEVIEARRSIRKFSECPVPRETLETILRAGIQAPSGKNRQPWRFVVVEAARDEMVTVMRRGIEVRREEGIDLGSSPWTLEVIVRAPVTVFVFNPYAESAVIFEPILDGPMNAVDIQSVGAAIQNICLAATELGLGSLWICDVYYAYAELCEWLGEPGQMIAAVSLGYPDESPGPRPRKPLEEVTTWK